MFVPSIEVVGLAREHLHYLGVRQKLIAENVSNVDTPNYTRKDLVSFQDALDRASSGVPSTTHPLHFAGVPGQAEYRQDREAEGYALAPSENDVTIEQEMVSSAEVKGRYQLTAQVLRSMSQMLSSVLSTRS